MQGLDLRARGVISVRDAMPVAKLTSLLREVEAPESLLGACRALVHALRERRIAGAALDVFGEGSAPPPPLPDDSALYDLDNVVLTPHIGWQRLEARQRVVDMCAENVAAFARGEPMNIDMATGLPRTGTYRYALPKIG